MRDLRVEYEGNGQGFRLVDRSDCPPRSLAQGLGVADVLALISQASGELRRWGASGVEGMKSELSRVLKLVGGSRR
jgi:hypothetical protein